MHDIKAIRDNPAAFDAGLARRGMEPLADTIGAEDARWRAVSTAVQEGLARRNEASKLIGAAMARGDKETAEALKAEVAALKAKLPELEMEERRWLTWSSYASRPFPTCPPADVPQGTDETDNVEEARWGSPRAFNFAPQGPCRFRAFARSGFRGGGGDLGRALRRAARTGGTAAPRAGPIYARHPDRAERL